MGNDTRETLRNTFDQVADLYDCARPNYPDALFDDLFALGSLTPAATVLEIGCGTGKASRPIAQRGCRLVCVELGSHLAEVARRNLANFPQAQVVNTEFETWESPAAVFDAVFAAASWHWLDPAVRYAKSARMLKPGGMLAIVSGGHAFPQGFDPFFTEIQECYNAIGEGVGKWPPAVPDEVPDLREEIEGSGLFEDVRMKRYLWTVDYTASQYVDLLETFSGHRAIEQSKRDLLYADVRRRIDGLPGGRVRKHYLNVLHVARRNS